MITGADEFGVVAHRIVFLGKVPSLPAGHGCVNHTPVLVLADHVGFIFDHLPVNPCGRFDVVNIFSDPGCPGFKESMMS